ncbi:PrsW family glutamic-type intramembrane protease [Bacteroidota bacterium]
MHLLLSALAPVIIILFYIYFRDKYEKEPISLLLLSILAGVIIVLPILLIEGLISSWNPFAGNPDVHIQNAAYDAFLVASLVEEGFKFLALYLLLWRNKNFNEKFDGIVYAVFISLGFAAVENIMYVNRGGYDVALIRAMTAVPAHALFGIRMGYFFGVAKMYSELRKTYLPLAFLYPFLLHGVYDFLLMTGSNWLLVVFVPYLVLLYFLGFRKMKITSDTSIYNTKAELEEEQGGE